MDDELLISKITRYAPNLALDRHAALLRMRMDELKKNPEAARWHRNPDGSVYRESTELSVMLEEHTSML